MRTPTIFKGSDDPLEANPISPAQAAANPIAKVASDLFSQLSARRRAAYPPGPTGLRPTFSFISDPLQLMLSAYQEYGPVFTLRTVHELSIWALGAEAQHQILVSDADALSWRHGGYRELIPFLGDGLITTDHSYHDRCRRTIMPAFHSERLVVAAEAMAREVDLALDGLRHGVEFDAYAWARGIAMRVAIRVLFGLDPDRSDCEQLAKDFESGLSYYGNELWLWMLRGPLTPYSRLRAARERIAVFLRAEIERRRGASSRGEDILSLLMEAHDDDGSTLTDEELLDHCLTLLFAGHDTTSMTVAMALGELSAAPRWCEQVGAEVRASKAGPDALLSELPLLEQTIDETLRLYPPVPAGLRRASRDLTIAGIKIPAGASINYCSWATHRLPELFPDPNEFKPERMTRERKSAMPKGAYAPFGGGRRICIGKRFGYLEAKIVLGRFLSRFQPGAAHGSTESRVTWSATLVPSGGLPITPVSGPSGASR